jgi:hypothetical protein
MKYKLPETPETEDTLCMKITIPDTREYRVAFWTSLYHLGKWNAWETDGTDRAKRAAALWKPIIEANRLLYEAQEMCGETDMEVRQNPVNPCKLEYREGAGEWLEFANLNLCKGLSDNLPTLYPDGPDVDDKMQFVANIIKWIQETFTAAAPYPSVTPTYVYQQINTSDSLRGVWLPALGPVSVDLAQAIQASTATDLNNLKNPSSDAYKDLAQYITCYVTEEDDKNWLDELSDKIFEWLNTQSGALFDALNAAFSHATSDMLYTVGSGAAGFGGYAPYLYPDGMDCAVDKFYDFRESQFDWVIDPMTGADGAPMSVYTPGVGFTQSHHFYSNIHTWTIGATLDFGDNFYLTKAEFYCYAEPGANFLARTIEVQGNHYGASPVIPLYSRNGMIYGWDTYGYVGEIEIPSIICYSECVYDESDLIIQSAKIEGYYHGGT